MNDLIELLRGRRIDGRSADEIMRLAADEIESLQSQLSYRIEERDDSNGNLTAALRREVASKDRLAEAEALLREARDALPTISLYEERVEYLKNLRTSIDAFLGSAQFRRVLFRSTTALTAWLSRGEVSFTESRTRTARVKSNFPPCRLTVIVRVDSEKEFP